MLINLFYIVFRIYIFFLGKKKIKHHGQAWLHLKERKLDVKEKKKWPKDKEKKIK